MKSDKRFLYVPYEIHSDLELTIEEKYVLSVVNSIPTKDGVKKASNKTLAEWANIPEWKLVRVLSSLKKKGRLEVKNGHTDRRIFVIKNRESVVAERRNSTSTTTNPQNPIDTIYNIYNSKNTSYKTSYNTECAYKDIYSINKSLPESSCNGAPSSSFIEVDI